jgi:hypothetical protein
MNFSNDPIVWGKKYWYVMKSVATNYVPTKENKIFAKYFYTSLSALLPCDSCKKHYKKVLLDYPIESCLNSSEELFNWVLNIEKKINAIVQQQRPSSKAIELAKNQKNRKLPRKAIIKHKMIRGTRGGGVHPAFRNVSRNGQCKTCGGRGKK